LSCCQIPLAILLIFAGIFGFLPVPGLWMLRSDSFCSHRDPAFLERPMARMLGWVERKWIGRQRAKSVQ
jgi:hypothetical protein